MRPMGAPAPVHVLCTPEPLLLERRLAEIRDAAVPEAARGLNHDVLEGRGATADRILGAARTLPMMAERRLVVVRDVGAVAAAELASLVPYLEDPNPSTVLVFTAAKVDRRVKFYALAKKLGYLEELEAPRNLGAWVRDEVARRELAVRPDAQRRLVEVVGKDLARLSLALDQLALYAGDRPATADDVDDLIAETRERTVFELTDAIGAGDARRTQVALAALFDQRQSAIGVLVMLGRHMRQLGLYHAGLAERLPKGELARVIGVPPFVVDKLGDQARRYQPEAVQRAIGRISEADRALKGQAPGMKTLGRHLGERVVLDRVVGDILALAGRRR
jgi:DNA polymerase III subunit delta